MRTCEKEVVDCGFGHILPGQLSKFRRLNYQARMRVALDGGQGQMNGTTNRRPSKTITGITCYVPSASLGFQPKLVIVVLSLLSTSCAFFESKAPAGLQSIEQLESALATARKELTGLQTERLEVQRRYEAALKVRDELLAAQAGLKTKLAQAEEVRAALAESGQKLQRLYDGALVAEHAAAQQVSQLQRDLQKAKQEQNSVRASLAKVQEELQAARALPPGFYIIDELIRALPVGNIAFSYPPEMFEGDSGDVDLLLSVTEAADELKTHLRGEARDTAQLQVSTRMRAELKSDKFTITSLSPEEQVVGVNDSTEWRWKIRSAMAGDHSLHLGLSAIIDVDGREKPKSIKTFDRVIRVRVKKGDRVINFLKENWQWLAGTLLIPLAIWVWASRRRAAVG
jgi:hypothetical protein